MALAWIVGACSGRQEALDLEKFPEYYDNVLRFQGSYIIYDGTVSSTGPTVSFYYSINTIDPLNLSMFRREPRQVDFESVKAEIDSLGRRRFACLISLARGKHTIAVFVGYSRDWYIFDSLAGLFYYDNDAYFSMDIRDVLAAMHMYYKICEMPVEITPFYTLSIKDTERHWKTSP